jgi:hypothetical protein
MIRSSEAQVVEGGEGFALVMGKPRVRWVAALATNPDDRGGGRRERQARAGGSWRDERTRPPRRSAADGVLLAAGGYVLLRARIC